MRFHEDDKDVSLFGGAEFIASVHSDCREWNSHLIAPKTFEDYWRLLKGRISDFELKLKYQNFPSSDGRTAMQAVDLIVEADGDVTYGCTIDAGQLIKSTVNGDRYFIATCSCGEPFCAGIKYPVVVVHHENLVFWKAYYARGRKIFIFQKEQYRSEILSKCGEAIRFAQGGEGREFEPYTRNLKLLEKLHSMAMDPNTKPDPRTWYPLPV